MLLYHVFGIVLGISLGWAMWRGDKVTKQETDDEAYSKASEMVRRGAEEVWNKRRFVQPALAEGLRGLERPGSTEGQDK